MSEPAKHKLREWIGQAAVGLPVLYPLSIGPAAWMTVRLGYSWTRFTRRFGGYANFSTRRMRFDGTWNFG